jgi:anti-sigma factor RsiW
MDRELPPGQVKEVETHLTRCTPCHDEYQSLLRSYQLVEQVNLLELDPDLWTRIHSEISEVSPPESEWLANLRSLFGVRWVPVAAGMVGVVFLSLFFMNQPDVETQQAFREYLQERRQSERSRASIPQNASSLEFRIAYPNPFIVSDRRPRENPFKLE